MGVTACQDPHEAPGDTLDAPRTAARATSPRPSLPNPQASRTAVERAVDRHRQRGGRGRPPTASASSAAPDTRPSGQALPNGTP